MNKFVIDASIAVKWVVEEPGTPEALALRRHALAAPDLLIAECANVLWKKVRLKEIGAEEAAMAALLLERADIELVPMRLLLAEAARLAIALDHPAYDCVYVALAKVNGWRFVTADEKFVRKLRASALPEQGTAMMLSEAASLPPA